MNLELLDRAAGATTCQILQTGGSALVGAGAVGIVGAGVGFVPLATGAAMLLAANYGCGEMPLGDAEEGSAEGCIQVATRGAVQVKWVDGTTFDAFPPGNYLYSEGQNCQEITECRLVEVPEDRQPWWIQMSWRGEGGQEYGSYGDYKFANEQDARTVKFSIRPFNDDCTGNSPETKPLPPEMFQPQPYTDEITNCNFNITFQGMAQPVPDGPVKPVYLLQQAGEERAAGGIMGGCAWPDTIFMPGDDGGGGGGGEPPVYLPVPPGPLPPNGPDGVPWWAKPLLSGATGAALNLIGQSLEKLSIPPMEAGSYTMVAPCDFDAEGNPASRTWTFEKTTQIGRLLMHQLAMMDMLQQHLVWKTPICGNERPELEGDWVTTRWESTEKMVHSGVRLRKLFRYRTKSTRNLGQLSAYWESFEWRAGPVCVRHTGAWWGDPQVWAESEEEGQRVIRHAAAEAGIDPDQVGEWATSSSRSPRYGMSGTMKILLKDGFPWVSAREGDSWPNTLAKAIDP